MIKKLDILIIRSFIGPFIVTFFVTLFVLVMQFFWLYMDELIGKGLGIGMIMQLMFYMSTTMVPLALPLSILFASIMTFGSLGENFELVAIKSSGISLLRFMRPLFLFIVFIGGLAFIFNNNVIPVANLKALSLLYDMRNSKPTLNIRPDQFNNEIQNYSIRVGSKDKDGHTIRDILIYDHTSGTGNDRVIIAKQGEMIPSDDKQYLIFRLTDGWRYEEEYSNGLPNHDQMRMHFKKWDKIFDLSSFRLNRTNEALFKGAYQMMNVSQLTENIDSLQRTEKKTKISVAGYVSPYVTWFSRGKDTIDGKPVSFSSDPKIIKSYSSSFDQLVNDRDVISVVQSSLNSAKNIKSLMDIVGSDRKIQNENYLKFEVEWHRKFTLSFACVLLFLIGAPLGSIIRKGGIGMPLVIAVAFFVVFHITSIVGEKLAKTNSLPPWAGMWLSTSMLLPIAFWLINKARNDSQIFTKDWYVHLFKGVKKLFVKSKTTDVAG